MDKKKKNAAYKSQKIYWGTFHVEAGGYRNKPDIEQNLYVINQQWCKFAEKETERAHIGYICDKGSWNQ